MRNYLTQSLDHPAYHQHVKLRGYNGRVTAVRAVVASDGARVLRRIKPDWTRQDHLVLAAKHKAEHERLHALHIELLDAAHLATFGTSRGFHDYRITAIGREEYPEAMKEQLRIAAYGSSMHAHFYDVHLAASKRAAH